MLENHYPRKTAHFYRKKYTLSKKAQNLAKDDIINTYPNVKLGAENEFGVKNIGSRS